MSYKTEYEMIKNFYGGKKQKRSQVPLINHIDEGLIVLQALFATDETKAAYCLHPLLQNDIELRKFLIQGFIELNPNVLILAMEYRHIANQYLPKQYRNALDTPIISKLAQVNQMLIADKVQNRKDFLKYKSKYPNSDQLYKYFHIWLRELGVSFTYYQYLADFINKEKCNE